MAFSIDPHSSGTWIVQYMDRMEREMQYRFRQLERNQSSMSQPMYYQSQYATVQQTPVPETAEQKSAKERAKKLRNLIAYYYSR